MEYSRRALCLICLEEAESDSTCCTEQHIVCDSCFLQYVETLADHRLAASRFRVPCPLDGAHGCGTYDAGALARVYVRNGEPKPLEHFLERALPQSSEQQEAVEDSYAARLTTLTQQLHVAISLRCPACDHVVDPTPDGCRAVECGHCGA